MITYQVLDKENRRIATAHHKDGQWHFYGVPYAPFLGCSEDLEGYKAIVPRAASIEAF